MPLEPFRRHGEEPLSKLAVQPSKSAYIPEHSARVGDKIDFRARLRDPVDRNLGFVYTTRYPELICAAFAREADHRPSASGYRCRGLAGNLAPICRNRSPRNPASFRRSARCSRSGAGGRRHGGAACEADCSRYRRLSARDAVHLSVMEQNGIERILSFDSGFDAFPRITRLS